MSTVSGIRTGIHSALAAITALADIPRYDALRVEDAFDICKRRPALVVVYQGRRKSDGPLSQTTRNTIRYRWAIVAVTEDWRTAIGACDAFLDISDSLDEIRSVDVTTVNDEPIRLRFIDEQVFGPPDRPVDAGPSILVTNWETTEVLA